MKPLLRVLVVEDSAFDAQIITSLIRKSGYDVSSERVETAESMARVLGEQPWDIILCDYNLPEFNAPAALRVLQSSGLDVPFTGPLRGSLRCSNQAGSLANSAKASNKRAP